jgi:hypothetical protein
VVRTAFAQKQCPRFEQTVASMADVGG